MHHFCEKVLEGFRVNATRVAKTSIGPSAGTTQIANHTGLG